MSKKTIRIWFGFVCLFLLLIAGISVIFFIFGNQKTEAGGTVKKNVRVLTAETDAGYLPIKVTEDTIVFQKDPKYHVGDVIVSGIIEEAPDGFIRKVVSVQEEDETFAYETEPAVLTDVFEELHLVRAFAITEYGIYDMERDAVVNSKLARSLEQKYMTASDEKLLLAGHSTSEKEKILLLADSAEDRELLCKLLEIDEKIGSTLSVKGEISFDSWFEVKIDIDHGDIEFGIVNHTKTDGEVSFGYHMEAFDDEKSSWSRELKKYDIPNFQFMVGFVPVVITNEVKFTLDGANQIEGSIGFSVETGRELIQGFLYDSRTGEITDIYEDKYLDEDDDLEWEVGSKISGKCKAGIYAHLVTKLYGSTGADLSGGMMGKLDGEIGLKTSIKNGIQPYGKLKMQVGPEIKGSVVVSVPVIDKKLVDSPLFEFDLPLFFDKTWEQEAPNTYLTHRAKNPNFGSGYSFEYSDQWNIEQEKFDDSMELDVLTNDRGVKFQFYELDNGFGSQYYGGAYEMRYAKMEKVAEAAFQPEDLSLGSFVVARLKEYAREDGLTGGGKHSVDGVTIYALVPKSYLKEISFRGMGYYSALSWENPSPTVVFATSPDGKFTEDEEEEIIAMLASFKQE